MNKVRKNQIRGYSMASIGFAMLLINAISYVFDLNFKIPAFTILGLVFVVIGLKIARQFPDSHFHGNDNG